MTKRLIILRAGLLMLCLASAVVLSAQKAPPKPASSPADNVGQLDGNKYSNSFYGMTVTIPEEFTIMNRAEVQVYKDAGADMLRTGKNAASPTYEEALAKSSVLLLVSSKPPGTPGIAVLEMVSRWQAPGVTRSMVLAETTKVLTASGKVTLKDAGKPVTLGGRVFSAAEYESEMGGQKLKFRSYITIVRGYALAITLTFTTPESESAFEEMLKTLVIKG